MATLTTSWQLIKQVYVGNDGYHDVYWRMYAKIQSQDTSTTYVNVEGRLYLTGSSGSLYLGTTSTSGGSVASYSSWGQNIVGTYWPGESTVWSGTGSFSTSAGSCTAGIRFYSSSWGWTSDSLYISDTLYVPSGAPSGLSANVASVTSDTVSLNVYCTNWNGGTAKHLTAMVLEYGATSADAARLVNDDVTTLPSVVTNSSAAWAGGITITGNTTYSYGVWASNGSFKSSTVYTNGVVTAAPKITNQSVTDITETTATLNYAVPADGGVYAKTYYYQLNGGDWVEADVVTGSTLVEKSITLTGLASGTEYTVGYKVITTAGTTICDNFGTFTTGQIIRNKLYGSVNGTTKKVTKLYGPVDGKTKRIVKLYGSVGGKTKRVL